MLQFICYIFLFAIAFVLIKFGIMLIMRCCILGIMAFIFVGIISWVLTIMGKISSEMAWKISEWAFYIGTGINLIEVLMHPFRIISEAWDNTTEDSNYSDGYSNDTSKSEEDMYVGSRCCGNCRFNQSMFRDNNVICNHNPAGQYNDVNDVCSDYSHF